MTGRALVVAAALGTASVALFFLSAHPRQTQAQEGAPAIPKAEAGATLVASLGWSRWSRHTSEILSVAVSPDGRFVATADQAGIARCERLADGAVQWSRTPGPQPWPMYWKGVAFSPDGTLLAVASDEGISLVEVATWTERYPACDLAWGAIRSPIAFTADGKTLVAWVELENHSSVLQLWDVRSGARGKALVPPGPAQRSPNVVTTSTGTIVGSAQESVYVWDAAGNVVLTLPARDVMGIMASPDGKLLATTERGQVTVWDLATGKEAELPPTLTYALRIDGAFRDCVAFSSDSQTIALCDGAKVTLYSLTTGEKGKSWPTVATGTPHALQYTPDQRLLVFARGPDLQTIEVATGKAVGRLGHGSDVQFVAFSADGKSLVSAAVEGTIRLWDLATKEERVTRTDAASGVFTAAVSPDGNDVVQGQQQKIWIWNRATLEPVTRHPLLASPKYQTFAFSPDGSVFADAVNYPPAIRLWNAITGEQTGTLPATKAAQTGLAFSPDGKQLASVGGRADPIRVWDVAKLTEIRHWSASNADDPGRVAYTADGKYLLTDQMWVVYVWDAAKGREGLVRRPFRRGDAYSRAFAITPDSKRLLIQLEGKVVLKDLETGRPTPLFDAPVGLSSAAFSSDGRMLAIGTASGEVSVYRIPSP